MFHLLLGIEAESNNEIKMKTQTSVFVIPLFLDHTDEDCRRFCSTYEMRRTTRDLGISNLEKAVAIKLYRRSRENGLPEDSPNTPFPGDGKVDRLEETVVAGELDFIYKIQNKKIKQGHFVIRYTQGLKDKAWMEEKDRKYLARLEHEKQAKEQQELAIVLHEKLVREEKEKQEFLLKESARIRNLKAPIEELLKMDLFVEAIKKVLILLNEEPLNSEFQTLFNTIILKSHETIVKKFYLILENPQLLYLDAIDEMFQQVIYTGDIKFPFTLASLALKSGEFSPDKIHYLVRKHLERIAKNNIYSVECTAYFKIILKSAKKSKIIDDFTKDVLDGYAENQRVFSAPQFKALAHSVKDLSHSVELLWLAVQQNREAIYQVGTRVISIEQHLVELNTRVNENAKRLMNEINGLKKSLRDKAQREARMGMVKFALGFIPLLGPVMHAASDSIMHLYSTIADFSDSIEIGVKILGIKPSTVENLLNQGQVYLSDPNNQQQLVSDAFSTGVDYIGGEFMDPEEGLMAWANSAVAIETGHYQPVEVQNFKQQIKALQPNTTSTVIDRNRFMPAPRDSSISATSSSTSQTPSKETSNSIYEDIAALVLRRIEIVGDRNKFKEQIKNVLCTSHLERLAKKEHVDERIALAKAIQDEIKEDLARGELEDAFIRAAIHTWQQNQPIQMFASLDESIDYNI